MDILIPIFILGGLGFLFGMGLAVFSRKFRVEIDPRLEKIYGLLPGSNCGACGQAGCFGFANAVLDGKLKIDTCRVSSDESKEEIAAVLGRELIKDVKKLASLHCNGGRKVKERFLYQGIQDCVAANLVLGGQKECIYGCLGFGTCVTVCSFGAIKMSDEGLPVVTADKCKGCNKCVEICPKRLFSLIPVTGNVSVACNSYDIGKYTRAVCSVGCIACCRCEQVCPADAVHVTNNLAVIDYEKCTSCGECVKVCPTKTIFQRKDVL